MKKFIISFSIFGLLCGSVVLAQNLGATGLRFVAPTVKDDPALTVADPELGEIVFNKLTSLFMGFNGTTWINMDNTNSAIPAGVISAFGGASAPPGYLLCDGQSYSVTTYPALAQALWDTNTSKFAFGGTGNLTSGTFNVPDFRGRFIRGADLGTGRDPNTSATDRPVMNSGGNTGPWVGSIQGQATKKNGLALSDAGHYHKIGSSTYNPTGVFANFGRNDVQATPDFGRSSTDYSNITLGNGDSETRPINANVNFIIKH